VPLTEPNASVGSPCTSMVESTETAGAATSTEAPGVLNGATHRPFARIKTMSANLTLDEARAKGYVKGNFKKEEFFAVTKRSTSPVTIYKKQKLDRDDIIDITDFDIVAWLKEEMRFMLEEEIARALLVGDGRAVDDEDKIKDPVGAQDGTGIRSIAFDHELYAATAYVNISDANSDYYEVIEQVLRQRKLYKGTGTPDFYTTEPVITEMLLSKDALGRRRFSNLSELAAELRVNSIVAVEAMEAEYAADMRGERIGNVGPQHVEGPVRDIDDAGNAEDQRQARGEERVEPAEQDALHDGVEPGHGPQVPK